MWWNENILCPLWQYKQKEERSVKGMVILEDKVHIFSIGIEGDMLSQIKIYKAFWEDGHPCRFSHPVSNVLPVLGKANPHWHNGELGKCWTCLWCQVQINYVVQHFLEDFLQVFFCGLFPHRRSCNPSLCTSPANLQHSFLLPFRSSLTML